MNNQENQITPITIVYEETTDPFEIKEHHHNCYELIYIVDGAAEFKIGNKNYNVRARDLIFINHLEAHEIKTHTIPYKRYFILIHPSYLNSIIKEPELLSIFKYRPDEFSHVLNLSSEASVVIMDKFKRIFAEFTNKLFFWNIVLESIIEEMLVFLYRQYSGSFPVATLNENTKTVYGIQRYIESHCLENLTLSDVSKKFFLDMYYLSHIFKKITGYNFKEYLILQRISKAKDFLYYSSDNITQVSIKSGFNNVNHFIRIFKQYTGITPFQYRKELR